MSGFNGVTFGSLTAKSIDKIDFNDFDLDKDGIVTQEEIEEILKKDSFDVLDLSTIDKDADKKVTKEEFELWQQESEMYKYLETLQNQAARDLVGQSPEDIKLFVGKLADYEKAFEEKYLKSHKDISCMADDFIKDITPKYNDIKRSVLSNTKSAVMTRVISAVIDEFAAEDREHGNTFLGLVEKNKSFLSDNAKRLLTKELSKEAEKFVKKYEGEDLEGELKKYLQSYLSSTDKEKLADAISVWEKGKESLEKLPEEIRYRKAKSQAKQVLITALENDITLKLGDVAVRTEAIIPAAMAQFKDSESLKNAVNKAISELSTKTRAQTIKDSEERRKAESVEAEYIKVQNEQKNIFE